ncbi:hypothetical protein B9479_004804 [Cryptococcus floricola]|uniref:Chromatin structure-remodeling complex protein RSC7 n=1 Tax=Cryptococcus floricola TaxID=2591691 RepID=A0A5D3AT31_9TREE|nr:hypothetical protein B9479_004804 [Cryptococcus floricola]
MSSRSRPKRASAADTPAEGTPRTRRRRAQLEYDEPAIEEDESLDEDAEGEIEEEEDDDESEDVAPQTKKRGRPKGSLNKKTLAKDGEEDDEEEDKASRRRGRKSVSYKEILPGEAIQEDNEDEDEDDDDDESHGGKRRGRPPKRAAGEDDGDDERDGSYKKEKIPGGSGRGGFSVKGAAAAAARARWEKVRREKAERGEEDTPKSSRKSNNVVRKHAIGPPADYQMGTTVTIKGEEYTVGDDELVVANDPKGDTKIDECGRLLGGREYKPVTFTSTERRNPDRLYALTIDAARACGYGDSLAFLRRYPTILKLSCTAGERLKLIDLNRISGNLKHRQVTMVALRNVYKAMGAKVVKNGRHVVDDYYEDRAAAECAAEGIEPGSLVPEEEFVQIAQNTGDRGARAAANESRTLASLSAFYTAGGLTTQFASNGIDPWTDGGWGNKRSKLKTAGVTEEDWMYKTAEESRLVDEQLKGFRAERLQVLEGVDGARGWVFAAEKEAEGDRHRFIGVESSGEMKKSGLSNEVVMGDEGTSQTGGDVMMDEPPKEAGAIIVEKEGHVSSTHNWGLGRKWQAGVIRAAYEPHTNTPHVPQSTQPSGNAVQQLSSKPILSASSDLSHLHHVQPTFAGSATRGLASVEYVLQKVEETEVQERSRLVQEAEEWEKASRAKQAAV